ncbi:MAG TPA: hypothetical protein VHH73_17815, partial [Verrucomicrobiae bacterium]|nr:hypothetical protein [Verrucomicrobiae bacterium]
PATALAGALASHAVKAAPAGLAGALAASALATSATLAPSALPILPLMATSKTPLAVTALIATLAAVPLTIQWRQLREAARSGEELRAQLAEAIRARDLKSGLSASEAADLEVPRAEHAELLRLRGEVNQLRRAKAKAPGATAPADRVASTENKTNPYQFNLNKRMPTGHTLVTGGWTGEGKRTVVTVTPVVGEDGKTVVMKSIIYRVPEQTWSQLAQGSLRGMAGEADGSQILSPVESAALQKEMLKEGGDLLSAPTVQTSAGMEGTFFVGNDETPASGQPPNRSLFLKLTPNPVPGGQTLDLAASFEMKVTPPGETASTSNPASEKVVQPLPEGSVPAPLQN